MGSAEDLHRCWKGLVGDNRADTKEPPEGWTPSSTPDAIPTPDPTPDPAALPGPEGVEKWITT